ncbi:MAG: DNA-3-methyladenine glycosylase I [Alphaproteobacteria bacterium]
MSGYCDIAPGHPVHGEYHDTEYGFPIADDDALFERLMLEVNQAGLSWELILKRRISFRKAYGGFKIDTVARYGAKDIKRLLDDPGVIRHRGKIEAAIANARKVQALRDEFGSFAAWIDAHHPLDKPGWVKLFRSHFKFAGPEIVGEFLMSIGYLPGAHRETCPVHKKIARTKPAWMRGGKKTSAKKR